MSWLLRTTTTGSSNASILSVPAGNKIVAFSRTRLVLYKLVSKSKIPVQTSHTRDNIHS